MNKTKILGWVVVLLVVLNCTTIATILYHNSKEKEEMIILEAGAPPLNGRYFKKELGFDKEQMHSYRTANHTFCKKANRIVSEIERSKEEMFNLLTATQPDSLHLDSVAHRIGDLHGELKAATASFYLCLKACCTSEQQVELQKIFTPLFLNPTHNGLHHGKGSERGKNKCTN